MIKKLRAQFLPHDNDNTSCQKIQNLRQHEKLVKEYTQEFDGNSLRCNLVESIGQKVTHYVNSFKVAIQDQVSLQQPYKVSLHINLL